MEPAYLKNHFTYCLPSMLAERACCRSYQSRIFGWQGLGEQTFFCHGSCPLVIEYLFASYGFFGECMKIGIHRLSACYTPVKVTMTKSGKLYNSKWIQLRRKKIIILGYRSGLGRDKISKYWKYYSEIQKPRNKGEGWLISISLENGKFALNIWFKCKSVHEYTWHRNGCKIRTGLIVYDKNNWES